MIRLQMVKAELRCRDSYFQTIKQLYEETRSEDGMHTLVAGSYCKFYRRVIDKDIIRYGYTCDYVGPMNWALKPVPLTSRKYKLHQAPAMTWFRDRQKYNNTLIL